MRKLYGRILSVFAFYQQHLIGTDDRKIDVEAMLVADEITFAESIKLRQRHESRNDDIFKQGSEHDRAREFIVRFYLQQRQQQSSVTKGYSEHVVSHEGAQR